MNALVGDPDLFISIAEPPTEKEYIWRSMQEGQDVIRIHPEDPNYRLGAYYIAVADTSADCTFVLQARLVQPATRSDQELFSSMQRSMYRSIKSGLQISEHRRRMVAGGQIVGAHFSPPIPPAAGGSAATPAHPRGGGAALDEARRPSPLGAAQAVAGGGRWDDPGVGEGREAGPSGRASSVSPSLPRDGGGEWARVSNVLDRKFNFLPEKTDLPGLFARGGR